MHRRGLRHKAVSVFVLVGARVLIQKRAAGKYHTPGLWANTCCTHPRWEETALACAGRRLDEELGIKVAHACLAPFVFASHAYEAFHLMMPLSLCRRWEGFVTAKEHDAIAWVKPAQLADYPMPPADEPLVAWLRDLI